ncbi:MAG: carbamoyltransferase N-terminal domain-containing protein, partial [Bryobacteraceae bacterium]
MIILGIGGFPKNSAAAVVKDGVLVAAIEEAKLSRQRRLLPEASMQACLSLAEVEATDVDCVAVVRPVPGAAHLHLQLRAHFPNSRIVLVEHHAAHAASAYFASPFDSATVLTLDRTGDFRCGALWRASANHIELERELFYPDSLGDVYGRVTELLGFEAGSEEHKVQWLSVAGEDRFRELFLDVLPPRDGSWPRVERSFIDSERMTRGGFGPRFFERLGLPDGAPIPGPMRAQVAASLQKAIEQRVLEMAG